MNERAEELRRQAKKSKAAPKGLTKAEQLWWKHCHGEKVSQEASIAFGIYGDAVQREIFEALLLSSCPPEEIKSAFNVPPESVAIYKELFFDPAKFRTGLERISYLENYPDEFGKSLKQRAVDLGYAYVLFVYANIVPKTAEQKALVQKMFMSSAYKAMNMNYMGMNAAAMNKAIEHGKLMLKAFETLTRLESAGVDESYQLTEYITNQDEGASGDALDGDII